MDNRVSFSLNEADKQERFVGLSMLSIKLPPKLAELASDEARELPVMKGGILLF
ncbi:MAG: hypothetical protein LBQ23_03625 [Puniceicoccales bacterium]|jgi:hypothetical protein|nr:hypothetical protein [Puniceicoccales bacterium]